MKVLIAGAGIAGPATAIALHKAGISSVIYEAYPVSTGEMGAFVTIAANGQDALRAIDVDQPVCQCATCPSAFVMRRSAAFRSPVVPVPLSETAADFSAQSRSTLWKRASSSV